MEEHYPIQCLVHTLPCLIHIPQLLFEYSNQIIYIFFVVHTPNYHLAPYIFVVVHTPNYHFAPL